MKLKTTVRRGASKYFAWLIIGAWWLQGRPIPTPHSVKQRLLRDVARQYGTRIMVETGTYRGDMVNAMKGSFAAIHSVEVYEPLFRKAVDQFAPYGWITIHLGNSAEVFETLLPELNSPTLFWLDGHYSGKGTGGDAQTVPVMGELEQISRLPDRHAILIDDAREFTGNNGYPTLDKIRVWAVENGYNDIEVADDVIRILPPASR